MRLLSLIRMPRSATQFYNSLEQTGSPLLITAVIRLETEYAERSEGLFWHMQEAAGCLQ